MTRTLQDSMLQLYTCHGVSMLVKRFMLWVLPATVCAAVIDDAADLHSVLAGPEPNPAVFTTHPSLLQHQPVLGSTVSQPELKSVLRSFTVRHRSPSWRAFLTSCNLA